MAPPREIKHLMDQGDAIHEAVTKSGTQLAEIARPIWEAAQKLGMKLDVAGFLYAWLSGTRVMAEKNTEGEIITLALVHVGEKWTHAENSATILELRGANVEAMVEFIEQVAAAMSATVLYREVSQELQPDGTTLHKVIGYPLGG